MYEGEHLSLVFLNNFKNTVERILHVPGNFTGNILEMAIVIDQSLTKEELIWYLPALLKSLKMHSQVFRNVRLNLVYWESDTAIVTKVSPMSKAMLHSFYDSYIQKSLDKTLECLASYLKLYHARSKLIILLTDGSYLVKQEAILREHMWPFLERKLMQVTLQGEFPEIYYRL